MRVPPGDGRPVHVEEPHRPLETVFWPRLPLPPLVQLATVRKRLACLFQSFRLVAGHTQEVDQLSINVVKNLVRGPWFLDQHMGGTTKRFDIYLVRRHPADNLRCQSRFSSEPNQG